MTSSVTTHRAFLRAVTSGAVALAGLLATAASLAQDGYYGPDGESTSSEECAPACRAGFACVEGVCTSPCNPPCAGREVCTRNGKCIPASPAVTAPPRPKPTPTAGWTSPARPAPVRPAFDQELYDSYKRKKEGGGAAMAVGVLFVCAAIGMGFASGLTGNEVLLWVAIGVEIIGDLFFFPGLAAWIKGKRGMERMEKNLASSDPARAGPRLAGVTPLVLAGNTGGGGGLALNFAF